MQPSKGTSSNILAISVEIRIQGLTTLSGKFSRDSTTPGSPKWDTTLATLSIERQNNPSGSTEDDNLMFPHVLDLTGGNANEKRRLDYVDNRPLSLKLSKKGFSSFAKVLSDPLKTFRDKVKFKEHDERGTGRK